MTTARSAQPQPAGRDWWCAGSAVHGLSMLLLDGLLPDDIAGQFPPADADVLVARVLDVVAFGLLPSP